MILKEGIRKLNYKGGYLSHNRQGCIGTGFCELGCALDAKMNALRVLIPPAVESGGVVLTDTKIKKLRYLHNRIFRAEGDVISPVTKEKSYRVRINASVFISCAGAIETPALLKRSEIPDPHGLVGKRFHLHPGVVAAGIFSHRIELWKGVPQSYECTEFLSFDHNDSKRLWIVPGAAHPAGAAFIIPGIGREHQYLMKKFPYMAALTAMLHDTTSGEVDASGDDDVEIKYELNTSDRRQLSLGLKKCAEILFAAGAKQVLIPFFHPLFLRKKEEISKIPFILDDLEMDILAVHPQSSVWMGLSKKSSCININGQYHHLENLYIADTSVFPSSLGVPPQISTYAFGFYVADSVKRYLKKLKA
jgi:choline dehydrogenase-like flavoprotein